MKKRTQPDRRPYHLKVESPFADLDAVMTGVQLNRVLKSLYKIQIGMYFQQVPSKYKRRKYMTPARMKELGIGMKVTITPYQLSLFKE